MRIAFLMQCHKKPDQVNQLIDILKHPCADMYVHVDKKSSIADQIQKSDGVYLLEQEARVDVKWATFSQVEATLQLLYCAHEKNPYDYYFLISGQDYPIRPVGELLTFLENCNHRNFVNLFDSKNTNGGKSTHLDKRNDIWFDNWMFKQDLLHRVIKRLWVEATGGYQKTFGFCKRKQPRDFAFYFGSSWWCIDARFTEYLLGFMQENPEIYRFFRHASCPDESFFQSILMNSPFRDTREDYLHYVNWTEGKNSPNILTVNDYPVILASGKFMARKFESSVDSEIIRRLSARCKDTNHRD